MTTKSQPQTYLYVSEQAFNGSVFNTDGKGLHWTTDINAELPIEMHREGIASTLQPSTMGETLFKQARKRQHNPALKVMRNNQELVWSWDELWMQSVAFAKSLTFLGVNERRAVNIMGFNSPEWVIACFGAMMHNNVVSGIYITNGESACQYQASHSEAEIIVVDT